MGQILYEKENNFTPLCHIKKHLLYTVYTVFIYNLQCALCKKKVAYLYVMKKCHKVIYIEIDTVI